MDWICAVDRAQEMMCDLLEKYGIKGRTGEGLSDAVEMMMPRVFKDEFLELQIMVADGTISVEAFRKNIYDLATSLDAKLFSDSVLRPLVRKKDQPKNRKLNYDEDFRPEMFGCESWWDEWWSAVEKWAETQPEKKQDILRSVV